MSPTSKNTVKAVYSAEIWRRKGLDPERAFNADAVTDATDLGALLTWLIDRAENGEEATVITRGDRDVAAVVPMAVLRHLQVWAEEGTRLATALRDLPSVSVDDAARNGISEPATGDSDSTPA